MGGRAFGIALLLALLGGLTIFGLVSRENAQREARTRLVQELRDFHGFAEHSALLLETVDEHHDELADAHMHSRTTGGVRHAYFDRDNYRLDMYRRLRRSLTEAGYEDAAIELEQYRARAARR